jgi:TolA-binding protein
MKCISALGRARFFSPTLFHTKGKSNNWEEFPLHRNLLAILVTLVLILTSSAVAAAHPEHQQSEDPGRHGHHHHQQHQHPQVDWSATPADIQAVKAQLDRLRTEQKGLFEQIRQQREQIKSAHQNLKDQNRQAVKGGTKELVKQLHTSRESIHSLREQAHAEWHRFYDHNQAKQWDAAKTDLHKIVTLKQEIITNQKMIVRTQQRIVELMKP